MRWGTTGSDEAKQSQNVDIRGRLKLEACMEIGRKKQSMKGEGRGVEGETLMSECTVRS